MKKQFFKIFVVAFISLIFLGGCDLTREPYDAIPRENSLQSITDAKKWDTGFMSLLRNRVGGYYSTSQDFQADYLNASADYGNRGGSFYTWQTLNSGDYDVKDIWHSYYIALKNINEFLHLTADLQFEKEADMVELNSYKGDAHLLRAFYYYELAIRYGTKYNPASASSDLCVPLILQYDFTELPSRATNAEVYGQIAKDIDAAKLLLSARANKPMSLVLTADAAIALEARVALAKKDWPAALAAAEKLIVSGTYPLVSPEAESFSNMWRADNSSEDIVQLYVKRSDEEPRTIGFYGYSEQNKANMPDFFPTQGIIDLFDAGDLRKPVYFEKAAKVKVGDYNMDDVYVISKYLGNPAYNTTATPRYILRPKLFRMGEIYTIAAEAAFMVPNTTKAAQYLNDLRISRGLTAVGSVTLQDIKDERTRELAFEGQRFFDLRRWNDPMNRLPPQSSQNPISATINNPIGRSFLSTISDFDLKVPASSHRWIWPIPYNELTTNVNIKDQQNPGW